MANWAIFRPSGTENNTERLKQAIVSARQQLSQAFITGAQRNAPVFKLIRGRFDVFRPTGATRCTDGSEIWQGGGDRATNVPSSVPNFTPIGATVRV